MRIFDVLLESHYFLEVTIELVIVGRIERTLVAFGIPSTNNVKFLDSGCEYGAIGKDRK